MDASERGSSSVPSRKPLILNDGFSLDDCQFCGATLDPTKLVVNLKSGAVTVRCDNCKEVNAPGEIEKETLTGVTAPVVQQPCTSKEETEKLPGPFLRSRCSRSFSMNYGLKRHVLAAHPTTDDDLDLLKEVDKGPLNGSVEKTKGTTPDSSQTRGKLFVCAYCFKKFSRKSSLIAHSRIHTGEKPFDCNECGKKFNQKANLDFHVRLHHMKDVEKQLECNRCGKKFGHKYDLRYHIKAHTQPFDCNHCGKRFGFKAHLTSHIRTHTGEKPYECNHCGKKFRLNRSLTCHIRIHTGEKPFECKTCGKCFSQSCNAARHEKARHAAETVKAVKVNNEN